MNNPLSYGVILMKSDNISSRHIPTFVPLSIRTEIELILWKFNFIVISFVPIVPSPPFITEIARKLWDSSFISLRFLARLKGEYIQKWGAWEILVWKSAIIQYFKTPGIVGRHNLKWDIVPSVALPLLHPWDIYQRQLVYKNEKYTSFLKVSYMLQGFSDKKRSKKDLVKCRVKWRAHYIAFSVIIFHWTIEEFLWKSKRD